MSQLSSGVLSYAAKGIIDMFHGDFFAIYEIFAFKLESRSAPCVVCCKCGEGEGREILARHKLDSSQEGIVLLIACKVDVAHFAVGEPCFALLVASR